MTQTNVALLGVAMTALVAVVGWLVTQRSSAKLAVRARQADHIRTQIGNLYGPLVFFAELNELLLIRSEKIRVAYDEYFDTRQGDRFSKEMTEVIAKMNLYGQKVVCNNQDVIPLLRDNWGLLDANDAELVKEYLSDIFIQDLESDREGPTLPAEFYLPKMLKSTLGPKMILRPGFAESLRRSTHQAKGTQSIDRNGPTKVMCSVVPVPAREPRSAYLLRHDPICRLDLVVSEIPGVHNEIPCSAKRGRYSNRELPILPTIVSKLLTRLIVEKVGVIHQHDVGGSITGNFDPQTSDKRNASSEEPHVSSDDGGTAVPWCRQSRLRIVLITRLDPLEARHQTISNTRPAIIDTTEMVEKTLNVRSLSTLVKASVAHTLMPVGNKARAKFRNNEEPSPRSSASSSSSRT
jgi:hypothetical protein